MVTTKKRQDFRIRLQKRARRRAEKRVEYLEDDKSWKDVRIHTFFEENFFLFKFETNEVPESRVMASYS